MRSVAIPRARTKYLTLTIGETRSLAALAPPTNLTSRLENIAASCYLHSPIEAATARAVCVSLSLGPSIFSRPLCTPCVSLPSSPLCSLRIFVPPSLTGLLCSFERPSSSLFSRALEHYSRSDRLHAIRMATASWKQLHDRLLVGILVVSFAWKSCWLSDWAIFMAL